MSEFFLEMTWLDFLKGDPKTNELKHLVFITERNSGVHEFINFLTKSQSNTPKEPLSYTYYDELDEEGECKLFLKIVLIRVGVNTVIDDNIDLLDLIYDEINIENSLFVLFLDWSAPWKFMKLIQKWVSVLQKYQKLKASNIDKLKENGTG